MKSILLGVCLLLPAWTQQARYGPVPFGYFCCEPLRIGNQVQLLVDDCVVDDRWKVTRETGSVLKHLRNPVLAQDKPWEEGAGGHPTVIYDEKFKKFRMYYTCFSLSNYFSKQGPSYYIAYAESEDGFTRVKPALEGFPFRGYERTNVINTGEGGMRAMLNSCCAMVSNAQPRLAIVRTNH
ncbi:MAG: hypothetical protein ABFD86_02810 [Bryobacteraceae bacterium]